MPCYRAASCNAAKSDFGQCTTRTIGLEAVLAKSDLHVNMLYDNIINYSDNSRRKECSMRSVNILYEFSAFKRAGEAQFNCSIRFNNQRVWNINYN